MQTTLAQFNAHPTDDRFSLQNPRMLRLSLDGSAVHIRPDTVVAQQGDVQLTEKQPPPGTGMQCIAGRGEAFLADQAQNVHLVELEAEEVVVDVERVLAVDEDVEWRAVGLGGVSALALSGSGWVALLSHGSPVLLDVSAGATFVRAGAAIVWSGEVDAESATGGQLRFRGHGWVLVQASPTAPGAAPGGDLVS